MSEGVVASVLAHVGPGVDGRPHGGVVAGGVNHVLGVVAVRDLVLIPPATHGRLAVREQVLGGVLVQGAELASEEVLGGGLVHGAGPDGGGRGQGLIKLVACHRGDGGAGLGRARGRHQVPVHLRTVGGAGCLGALLHDTNNDEDEDEDHDDTKGDDQD